MQTLPPLLCVGDGDAEVGADDGADDGDADEVPDDGGWVVDCVAVGEGCAPMRAVEDVVCGNAWRGA
jgi:hypothetical protein